MRRTSALIYIPAIMLQVLCASAGPDRSQAFTMATPEQFALLPCAAISGDLHTFLELRDCGFNLAGFVTADQLDLVARAGLKCLVQDPSIYLSDEAAALPADEINKRVAAITARVKTSPAVYGYWLRDEPWMKIYPGLRNWISALRVADAPHVGVINLYPNYVDAVAMNGGAYDNYVESFAQTVKPGVICYDHYALMDDGSIRDGYFQNLETVRASAIRNSLPFWNIIQSAAFWNYAEPSAPGLSFLVYTTLAYGGRGISYYPFLAADVGNYRLAPVDQWGRHTVTWQLIHDINWQVHRLVPTYNKLRNVNVFHVGDVPKGCRESTTSIFLSSISGGKFCVGEFQDQANTPYVLVVHKDLQRSVQFSIQPKKPANILRVSPFTGDLGSWSGENNWIGPGQGMLLKLEAIK